MLLVINRWRQATGGVSEFCRRNLLVGENTTRVLGRYKQG